ncbi:MAG: hypothetical protein ACI8WM_003565, partial [Burkholderiaceae bacterium]
PSGLVKMRHPQDCRTVQRILSFPYQDRSLLC